jgi:hypothetical protein
VVFLSGSESVPVFLLLVNTYIAVAYYQEGDGIPLTGLPLPHFGSCPKPEPRFSMPYAVVFLVFNDLR